MIAHMAVQALEAEAALAPKPGLVTPFSQGAHRDMDYSLFLASAKALEPCFDACVRAGMTANAANLPHLLERLRGIGLQGEEDMFRATGGVNTHKGAIFCLGLLCAAMGVLLEQGATSSTVPLGDRACALVARLCEGLVDRELGGLQPRMMLTAGERLYRDRGLRGARGQAEDGYPLLRLTLLPLLRNGHGHDPGRYEQACLDALLHAMVELEDSCLLTRGGMEGLALACDGARDVLGLGGAGTLQGRQALARLDHAMSQRGLSPGGCADMLAAALFLVEAEHRLAGESCLRLWIA
jgi:triphosphoribosyl-dephospho-CoA synthase CitG